MVRQEEPLILCLGDFGESIDVSQTSNYQAQLFVGTEGYLPPEMKDPSVRDYSFSIDLFSAAAVVRRAATF